MNPSNPAPDSENPEYQPQDRAAPALKKGEIAPPNAAPAAPMLSVRDETKRGELFDVQLDEGGRLIEAAPPAPKRAGLWFFAALAALFCAYNFGAYVGQKSKTPAPVASFSPKPERPSLRLQVAGRVKKPGVYTLPGGARVEDALKRAGGALPGADLSALNLADWAVDGSKIEVPARAATNQPKKIQLKKIAPTPEAIQETFVTPQNALPEASDDAASENRPGAESGVLAPRNSGDSKSDAAQTTAKPKAPAGKTSESALATLRRSPIDLNQANAEQLARLPGVGPKMAQRILVYRRENGGFKSVADLDNVKGIGEKRMQTLQSLVRVK